MTVLDFINSEPILSIISAIVVPIITSVAKYISKDKRWKNNKEKSSLNLFTDLFIRMLQFGLIYMITSIFVITLLKEFGYKYFPTVISVILLVIIGVATFLNERKETTMSVWFNCTEKMKKFFSFMAYAISISLPIMLVFLFISNPGSMIFVILQGCSFVLCILFLSWMIILDGKKNFKYKCAKIYLKDNVIIENINATTLYFKGGWVIATKMDDQSEVRFKNQDIERVEYTQI